jgi:hypothetical protein
MQLKSSSLDSEYSENHFFKMASQGGGAGGKKWCSEVFLPDKLKVRSQISTSYWKLDVRKLKRSLEPTLKIFLDVYTEHLKKLQLLRDYVSDSAL